MTNEELALKIQQGDDGLLPELWEQVRKLIVVWANRYYSYKKDQHFELDDLIQSGYFAVLEAVKSYDPSRGFKFTTYLDYPIKAAFAEVAGLRTSKRDALQNAISLDVPASAEADSPLLDAIGDKSKTYDIDTLVIESVYNQELRTALDDAMEILTEKQRETLVLYYYFSLTLRQLAEIRGCCPEAVRNHIFSAFTRIYRSKHRKILADFLPDRKAFSEYRLTGFQHWKQTGCSRQEKFLIGWRKEDDNPTTLRQQNTDREGDA